MRMILGVLACLAVVIAVGGMLIGLVGFHYPVVVKDEPLKNPQKVAHFEGTNITLASGRSIGIDSLRGSDLSNVLAQSGFEVDLESDGKWVAVYARQDSWVDGTPWAQPIRIPLIADTVYENRRELIAIGVYAKPSAQPDAAHEPPPAVAVRQPSEAMNPKPESEAPADGGGR